MEQTSSSLVIIGAGPSALTTAIYTTREDIPTTLYERGVIGGMAARPFVMRCARSISVSSKIRRLC